VRRGLLVNVGLALASSALFLALLEGTARLLEKPRPPKPDVADYIWDWDDKMPGGFYVMKSDGVGWPPWEEFNRDGLRDRTRTHEKPEGLRRVAILGDSVTLGAEIRPDEAYPQRLEARFRAEGRRVEVMNVALWGWSTRQERTAWQRIARAYQPDQALLAVCLNDIPELFNNLSRPPRWLTRLHERSAVVRRLVDAEGREIDSVERLFAEPDAARVREAMDRFFDEVRALRRDVEADGATFVVVVLPFRFQVEKGAPPPVVQQRIAAFCESERLSCLDLLPTLARVGPSAFVDYDHLSSAGASLVADTLYASNLLARGDSVTDLLRDALGDRAADVSALTLALAGAGSTGVRAECAAALGRLGPAARGAVPALFVALRDPSEAVRAAAARALTAIGPAAEDLPSLVASLGSRDTYVVAFAAWSLGNLGPAAEVAVPDLARALARDDTNAVVAGALARIGPAAASAVGALVDGLRSDDGNRRWRAARTLGRIGPPAASAVPSLTAALSDPSSLVRLHAARALGRIGPAARTAAAALQTTTGDKDPNVGEEARQALGRLN
jgi:HEAT repeat protein/lysophospholipase L1-like esterase